MQGYFITFEGPDGSGKSSQINLLSEYFRSKGLSTLTTREPGEGEVGRRIRDLILYSELDICPECEALLYAADRAQHVHEVILPALARGEIVICDRFLDSSLAYQGAGRGLGDEAVLDANKLALAGLMPDITFIFDLSPTEAFKRKGGADNTDRIESEKIDFHDKVYRKFLELGQQYPERIVRIDARSSIADIHAAIVARTEELLSR